MKTKINSASLDGGVFMVDLEINEDVIIEFVKKTSELTTRKIDEENILCVVDRDHEGNYLGSIPLNEFIKDNAELIIKEYLNGNI